MEKYAKKIYGDRSDRLLKQKTVFLFVFLLLAISCGFTREYSKTLFFIELSNYENQKTYILDVENTKPSSVAFSVENIPDFLKIESIKKEALYNNGILGTRFTMVCEFLSPGFFEFDTIGTVCVNDTFFYASLKDVFISSDLFSMKSSVRVKLLEDPYESFECSGVIEVKNARSITSIESQLSPLTIVKKVVKSDVLIDDGNKDFVGVAEFTCVFLKDGLCDMPSFKVSLIDMHNKEKVVIPEISRIFVNKYIKKNEDSGEPFFAGSFEKVPVLESNNKQVEIETILKTQRQKKLFRTVIYFFIFLLGFVILIFAFLWRKNKNKGGVSFLLAFLCFIGVLFLRDWAFLERAICKNAVLRAIPEKTADSTELLSDGSVVTIKKKSGKWFFIEVETNHYGWIFHDECIAVK